MANIQWRRVCLAVGVVAIPSLVYTSLWEARAPLRAVCEEYPGDCLGGNFISDNVMLTALVILGGLALILTGKCLVRIICWVFERK